MKDFRFYRRKLYINLIHFFISSKELEAKMENPNVRSIVLEVLSNDRVITSYSDFYGGECS